MIHGTLEKDPTSSRERLRRAFALISRERFSVSAGVNSVVGSDITGAGEQSLDAGQPIPRSALTIGRLFQVSAWGKYTTGGGNLTLKLYAGTTLLLDTGAIALGAATNAAWLFKAAIHCLTTGPTGTVQVFLESATLDVATASAPAQVVTLDTTKQQKVTLTATWGAAGSTITQQIFSVTGV